MRLSGVVEGTRMGHLPVQVESVLEGLHSLTLNASAIQ